MNWFLYDNGPRHERVKHFNLLNTNPISDNCDRGQNNSRRIVGEKLWEKNFLVKAAQKICFPLRISSVCVAKCD